MAFESAAHGLTANERKVASRTFDGLSIDSRPALIAFPTARDDRAEDQRGQPDGNIQGKLHVIKETGKTGEHDESAQKAPARVAAFPCGSPYPRGRRRLPAVNARQCRARDFALAGGAWNKGTHHGLLSGAAVLETLLHSSPRFICRSDAIL